MVRAGEVSEHIYIVFTGECLVRHKKGKFVNQDMLRISSTGSFGEEGVFLGQPFKNDIVSCDDDTLIYRLSKVEIIRNFPAFIIKKIRKNLKTK